MTSCVVDLVPTAHKQTSKDHGRKRRWTGSGKGRPPPQREVVVCRGPKGQVWSVPRNQNAGIQGGSIPSGIQEHFLPEAPSKWNMEVLLLSYHAPSPSILLPPTNSLNLILLWHTKISSTWYSLYQIPVCKNCCEQIFYSVATPLCSVQTSSRSVQYS